MPPRLPDCLCLRALKAALPETNGRSVALCSRTFATTSVHQKTKDIDRRRFRDPYVVAQTKARKAANISRQEALRASRSQALGDPVRGIETDFVKSFDTAHAPSDTVRLNHSLNVDEFDAQITASQTLVTPIVKTKENSPAQHETQLEKENEANQKAFLNAHETVKEAIKRIANLDNGNAKDRFRVNVERCVATFGRHETDKILPPKPRGIMLGQTSDSAAHNMPASAADAKIRRGPDTGSSEVQIAVLTARIRKLADHLQKAGSSDKINKRNLRVLVHRRQKLLKYLRRSERAGPRWQRCIETLGLTEGTWKGEVSL